MHSTRAEKGPEIAREWKRWELRAF
uniref:Uncharacterized protein n=1 Tax=Anguilla anguilla TaxID=7936 RepID=A0A0E9TKZ1_ANGAN